MSYIYGLYDPRVNSIRYVGKTATSLEKRLGCHISEGVAVIEKRKRKGKKPTAVYQWVAKLLKEGVTPEIRLLEECDAEIEDYLEMEWIANMRLCGGPKLLNGTDGGTGGTGRSEEANARIAAGVAESWKDPEIRAVRIRGMSKPNGPRSDEFKVQRSEIQKQLWEDPEYRANQVAKRTGKHKTHCAQGHEFTPENTKIDPVTGHQKCRTCMHGHSVKQAAEKKIERAAQRAAAPLPEPRTHCYRGHELTDETRYVDSHGHNRCRICQREDNAKVSDRRKQERQQNRNEA